MLQENCTVFSESERQEVTAGAISGALCSSDYVTAKFPGGDTLQLMVVTVTCLLLTLVLTLVLCARLVTGYTGKRAPGLALATAIVVCVGQIGLLLYTKCHLSDVGTSQTYKTQAFLSGSLFHFGSYGVVALHLTTSLSDSIWISNRATRGTHTAGIVLALLLAGVLTLSRVLPHIGLPSGACWPLEEQPTGGFAVYITGLTILQVLVLVFIVGRNLRLMLRAPRVGVTSSPTDDSQASKIGLCGQVIVATLLGFPFSLTYLCYLFTKQNISLLFFSQGVFCVYGLFLAALPDLAMMAGSQMERRRNDVDVDPPVSVINPREGRPSTNIQVGHQIRLVAEYSPVASMTTWRPSTVSEQMPALPKDQERDPGPGPNGGEDSTALPGDNRLSMASDSSLIMLQGLRRLTNVQRPSFLPPRTSNPTPNRGRLVSSNSGLFNK